MTPEELWAFLPYGYLATVAIETPVLLALLSPTHSIKRRLFAGLWLTACSYPIVVLTIPTLIDPIQTRAAYLMVAETFAPLSECLAFALAAHRGAKVSWGHRLRDFGAIVAANLASFLTGEAIYRTLWR